MRGPEDVDVLSEANLSVPGGYQRRCINGIDGIDDIDSVKWLSVLFPSLQQTRISGLLWVEDGGGLRP